MARRNKAEIYISYSNDWYKLSNEILVYEIKTKYLVKKYFF